MRAILRWLARAVLALITAVLLVQIWFFGWVWWYAGHNPASTSFMRHELARIRETRPDFRLRQTWVPYNRISANLKRAVISAEDDTFVDHDGVNWEAIEKAYEHNRKLEEEKAKAAAKGRQLRTTPVRGGSTITQQLAKNLFLSGERTYLRKAQELVITWMIETMMDKERIFEIYLNVVEWGEGLFGAEAAAATYFGTTAAALGPEQGARLAAMLPRPKYYEKNPRSAYLESYSDRILARMHTVEIP